MKFSNAFGANRYNLRPSALSIVILNAFKRLNPRLWVSFLPYICVCAKLLQSCLTLCDIMGWLWPAGPLCPWDYPARLLEWVAISSFRGSPWPRNQTSVSSVSCIGRQVLYHYCHLGSPQSIREWLNAGSGTRTILIWITFQPQSHASQTILSWLCNFYVSQFLYL